MRLYETAFLITPKLEEEETEKLIGKMAEVVKKKKGKMVNIENWGKRKLAYPIDKLDEAVYVFFHYEGDPEIPHELQRRFRQTETVLRYLTLKKDEQIRPRKKTKPGRKPKIKTAAEKAKIKEEQAIEPEEAPEIIEEPSEKEPEVPPEATEPAPEKSAEEKE
jgi:small subunit ribosomal protein S6